MSFLCQTFILSEKLREIDIPRFSLDPIIFHIQTVWKQPLLWLESLFCFQANF